MKNRLFVLLVALAIAIIAISCNREPNYLPKPRGYFRIDLPKKTYTKVDTIERYSFECPDYALLTYDRYSPDEKNWINIEFPQFKGSIHLTHKPVNGNLGDYLEDVHTMVVKHLQKANGVRDSLIINEEHQVYGLFIEMDGKGVATISNPTTTRCNPSSISSDRTLTTCLTPSNGNKLRFFPNFSTKNTIFAARNKFCADVN